MSVRESLSKYLQRRRPALLKRLRATLRGAQDMEEVRHGLELSVSEVDHVLFLLAEHIAAPRDKRVFEQAAILAARSRETGLGPSQLRRIAESYRQIALRSVARHFADDPHKGAALELLESALEELESLLASSLALSLAREGLGAAHTGDTSYGKYFSLIEHASEAIISFRPIVGTIIDVNAQAQRLLGRSREQLLGTPFVDLFPDEHREQARWLVSQKEGASLRLEDMSVRRGALVSGSAAPDTTTGSSRSGDSEGDSEADAQPWRQPAQNTAGAGWEAGWSSLPDEYPVGRRGAPSMRQEVPVSMSCTWIPVEGQVIAQAILRDVTQLRQVQRELESYAVQLEERVAARTRELQQSEERYRALFLQEQRRAQHLSLINEVQRCALDQREAEPFLHCCAKAIQGHFRSCDVSFFQLEHQQPQPEPGLFVRRPSGEGAHASEELVCVAQAGGHGLSVPVGGRHPLWLGLIGQAAQQGQTLHRSDENLSGDVEQAPGVYRAARAEMCVPVSFESVTMGVLAVQSEEPVAFDARDAVALQTAAAIIASHLHSSRLFREMGELNTFHQSLVNTMSHSLMVVDQSGRMEVVNERLCATLSLERAQLLGQPMTRVFGDSVIRKHGLDEAIHDVTGQGPPREVPEVQVWTPDGTAVFDLRIFRVSFRGEPKAVLLLINITQRWRKTHQLQLMHEISRFFQASLDIDRVLHTVLTCITAGSSLGFNRAFVLLRDDASEPASDGTARPSTGVMRGNALRGAMALGPASPEEAGRVWNEISQQNPSLQEILAVASDVDLSTRSPLQEATRRIGFDLDNPALQVLAGIVREGRATCIASHEFFSQGVELSPEHAAQLEEARQLFIAPQMAIAPLFAKERVVGIVLADNLYSGAHIDNDDVQLLDTLAQQAGLTIDNALTYQALQKAQRGLVSAEKLAAVGEMAARVSHEIRNPLATIGGFARSVLRKPEDQAGVERKVGIIVSEVARLEELLGDLLDMARPRHLNWEAHSLNEVVSHALLLADADIKGAGVIVEKRFDAELPPIQLDRSRLLQAVLNIVRNGAQAMADRHKHEDGAQAVLEVGTRIVDRSGPTVEITIRDHGVGISPRAVKQIFDPFFSTKVSGSGLGLAVTRRILQDHGGDIEVESQEGQGTTFFLRFPLRTAQEPEEAASDAAEAASEAH
jgi:PAS domain S-box-containing protein